MTHSTQQARRFSRFSRKVLAIFGAGLVSSTSLAAQTMAPSAAPVEWVRYAESATATITQWLQADDQAAVDFRAYLDGTRTAPDQPTPPLKMQVQVAADGTISQLEFPPFAHAQANADLRGLIVGRKLAGPPPKDLKRSILLAIQLEPAAAEPAATQPTPATH